jgi:hypothetical protein
MSITKNSPVNYISNGAGDKWSAIVTEIDRNNKYTIKFDGCVVPEWALDGSPGPYNKSYEKVNENEITLRSPNVDDDSKRKLWIKLTDKWMGHFDAMLTKAKMAGFKKGINTTFCLRVLPGWEPSFYKGTALTDIDPETGNILIGIGSDGLTVTVGLEKEFVEILQNEADTSHVEIGKMVSFLHMDIGSDRKYDKKLKGTVMSIDPTTKECVIRSDIYELYGVTSYSRIHASLIFKN